ncbi:hypothetical protein O3M35_012419 [Rhynocoris fuscipes]|uniref:Uncharacterized protein n=1 Tax=Rhynocoris fuscipes TaxID=488301 RepID=A0AAW1CTI9_9HEMI
MNSSVSEIVKRSARRPWRWPWKHRHLTTHLYDVWSTAATTVASAVTTAHWPIGGGTFRPPSIVTHTSTNNSTVSVDSTFSTQSSETVLTSPVQTTSTPNVLTTTTTITPPWIDLRFNNSVWFAEVDLTNSSTTFLFTPSEHLSLATIVLLAFILGLIILATVIGKSYFYTFNNYSSFLSAITSFLHSFLFIKQIFCTPHMVLRALIFKFIVHENKVTKVTKVYTIFTIYIIVLHFECIQIFSKFPIVFIRN